MIAGLEFNGMFLRTLAETVPSTDAKTFLEILTGAGSFTGTSLAILIGWLLMQRRLRWAGEYDDRERLFQQLVAMHTTATEQARRDSEYWKNAFERVAGLADRSATAAATANAVAKVAATAIPPQTSNQQGG